MLAAFATSGDADDPLSALAVGEIEQPRSPDGWVEVELRATALNHHDIWSLRGIGLGPERLPMILGCDAAGVDPDGNEVIVHAVISDPASAVDETVDPARTLLSELHPGTLAERVSVPRRNLVPKPPTMSWEEAACLPTAYLTAYRMLFTKAQVSPGETVLIQGAAGGLATASIILAVLAGARVWVTGRTEAKRALALDLGAHQTFEPGDRLPERVDVVLDAVGAATWEHSMKALRPGGRLVVAGATSGHRPTEDLFRLFLKEIQVLGSTMGSREELVRLARMLDVAKARPVIDRVLPLEAAADAFAAMIAGEIQGKIVLLPGGIETKER
jgi:NADPH:quinone reductase-like Zn-dependent oxidoreductase